MPLVIAYEDAKTNLLKRYNPAAKGDKISLFGSRDNPNLPHATLNGHAAGGTHVSGTHFHRWDQFQVTVEGNFKIGRHELSPYCVHFSRAYTPYGPFVSDGTPFSFVVMRAHGDPGPQHLPTEMDQLRQVPDRQPWQLSRAVAFPVLSQGPASTDVMLQAVPDMKDGNGLAAYTLSMKPHAKALSTTGGLKRWQCVLCAFSYDEANGMPEEGIPAGTRWQDVPDTWSCPDCSASKSDFRMVEV